MLTYAFPGTSEEAKALVDAVLRFCTHKSVNGVMQPGVCPAHELLKSNYVNHLLTVRNTISRYLAAEFSEPEGRPQ